MRKAIFVAVLTALVLAAPLALASRSVTVTWIPGGNSCNSGVAPGQNAACFSIRPGERQISLQFANHGGSPFLKSVEYWGTGLNTFIDGHWDCTDAPGPFALPPGTAFVKIFFAENVPGVIGPAGLPPACSGLSAPLGGSVTATIS